jgi:hypothetical protein
VGFRWKAEREIGVSHPSQRLEGYIKGSRNTRVMSGPL